VWDINEVEDSIMELQDDYGRKVNGLRISVTQACNLNCIYCHGEGQEKNNGSMSLEQIQEIVDVTSKLGVRKIKITGGEPLMRKDIVELVGGISEIGGIEDISMTTNGILLDKFASELKKAGLDRVNISLDTLHPGIYSKITGTDSKYLKDVKKGVNSAIKASFYPVKLNMVVLKGLNGDRIEEMIDFAKSRGVVLQLIELLGRESPLYLNLDDVEEGLRMRARKIKKRRMHGRRKYFIDGAEVEVVRPHCPEFCMNCNRLRVTSDGKFKLCLLKSDAIDIKDIKSSFIEAVRKRRPFTMEQKCQ